MRLSLCTVLLCLGAFGATLERLSLEEMTARSTAIIRGRAVSSTALYIGSTIYTRTRFQVLERWKGPDGIEVDVLQPGGTVGGVTQKFTGVPRFSPNQELVLFLWTGPSGRTQVIGLSQGVFELERSAATGEVEVSRMASGELMLEAGSGRPVQEPPVKMPLRSLVSKIRAVENSVRK